MSINYYKSKIPSKNRIEHEDNKTQTIIKVAGFEVYVWDSISQRRFRKKYKSDYKTVQMIEKKIKTAIKNGDFDFVDTFLVSKPKTVGDLFVRFKREKMKESDRVGSGVTAKTIKRYKNATESFVGMKTPIAMITTRWIEQQIQRRLKKGIRKQSVNTELRHVKALLNWSVKHDLVDTNPFEKIPFFKIKKKEPRVLSPEELQRIAKACKPGTRWYPLFMFYFLTGARLSEPLKPNLRWSDIDLENEIITLPIRKGGKSSTLPLQPGLAKILKELKLNPTIKKSSQSNKDNDYPFPFSPSFVSKKFKKEIFEPAGITDFTVHDLRRSFGSYLLDLGYNIAEVSGLMGHSSVKVTEEHYICQLDYKKRKMMNSLEESIQKNVDKTGAK